MKRIVNITKSRKGVTIEWPDGTETYAAHPKESFLDQIPPFVLPLIVMLVILL